METEPSARTDEDAFEALSDCASCGVEAAVVELIATRGGRGVVLESRCRLCLRELREGAVVHAGEALRGDLALARSALSRWAEGEGDPDAERFVLAHFGGAGLDDVARKLAAGERVETSFDAIAWLFPGVGAVGGGGSPESDPDADLEGRVTDPHPRRSISPAPMRRSSLVPAMIPVTHESIPAHRQPLRVSARALCSVMLADGAESAADRAFVDRTLASWGHPPLRADDLAIWRPHDLGWPDDPARVVEAMARLAYVDGDRDATEWRVVREFARAWGVSLEHVESIGAALDREHQRGVRRVVSRLTSLFVR